jgi:peptidoglycan/xylan/chitin deacetylase (PgdA/CDA1 family)
MSGGTFAISLDFALYWGMRDRQPFSACQTRLQGVYQAIPALLTAFQQANIHATWAVVGLVFFRDTAELRYHLPSILPQYHDRRLNPFLYLPNTERHPDLIPYYYAPQLIQAIQRYAGQEIASHSFSHFNIGATGATLESFTTDVQAAKNIANRFGIALKSHVFPRQQYCATYIEPLSQQGIQAFRGNPASFIYNLPAKRNALYPFKRGLRFLDSLYNLTGHHTFKPSVVRQLEHPIINIPASRFFNPFDSAATLNTGRIKRIMQSMTHAAQQNEVFHLWWHPEDFGVQLTENMQRLEQVLEHYLNLKAKYGMVSQNMQEIAQAYPVPHVHNVYTHPLGVASPANLS